jgi:hypothetical protein
MDFTMNLHRAARRRQRHAEHAGRGPLRPAGFMAEKFAGRREQAAAEDVAQEAFRGLTSCAAGTRS